LFLISLIGVFGLFFSNSANADLAPGIFVTELNISGIKDNEIKGEFTIWNSEKYYLTDLNYEIKLLQGDAFKGFISLLDVGVSKEMFFVAPGQKITKPFAFQYPKNIIDGDYTLRAQIITSKGSELGWEDKTVSLKGENKFLEIIPISAKVSFEGEDSPPGIGITIGPEEKIIGIFSVKNLGKEITVIPRIKIFKRQFNMPLAKEYQDKPITFKNEETKEIRLEMPSISAPESYLAEVKLYKDNQQISGIVYFRWVVEGQGGKVLYIKTDKDSYGAGENMEITITSVGPADLSNIGAGKLEVAVYDNLGNVVAKTSKDITLNPHILTSVITIPVEKDLISPRIEAKLTKGENVLDQHTADLPIFSNEAKQIEKEAKLKKLLLYLIPAIIILLILLVVAFLVYKFKIRPVKFNGAKL